MARRRRLETPGAAELADIEAGFAAKPVSDRMGLTAAPIAQIAGEIARMAQPLDTEQRVTIARDSVDAAAWRDAVDQGRVISDLPLAMVNVNHLIRDRMVVESTELDELKVSIVTNGLRLPIEVIGLPDGQFGLVSGWRRMHVLAQLASADPERYATVKAIIRAPYEAGAIYTAMVEENELRSQISPYERGRIAVKAAEAGAFINTEAAIETIFAAASRAKRSKIRSFALLHEELGDMLQFPTDLSERNGLRLAHALREGHSSELRHALIKSKTDHAYEWALIEPIIAKAETVERGVERGGRPRIAQSTKRVSQAFSLQDGVTIEAVRHEDGYSIRLRGTGVDTDMIDSLMADLRLLMEAR